MGKKSGVILEEKNVVLLYIEIVQILALLSI